MKIAILNLILSLSLLFANLLAHAYRNQSYPTSETQLEALYNLFIQGNLTLPLIIVYLILSVLYFKRVKRKRGY